MARRAPTPEQKAKAALRRERFRQLAAQVAEMTDDERAALVMKVGSVVTCEGRALSPFNSCLVLTQLPTASMVGGFRQWLDKGRSVRKGEHGLMIWVPTGKAGQGTTLVPSGEPEPTTGAGAEHDSKRSGFVMGTVFDVSQTEPAQTRDRIDRQRMDELAQDAAEVGGL
jgi:hypothetical protein